MEQFKATGLEDNVLRAIRDLGFEEPTPIQAKTIPFVLQESRDMIALAQTGTGKTAAFGLPLVQCIVAQDRWVQALILCPTRELCLQIAGDLDAFAKHLPKIKTVAVYGGSSIERQQRALGACSLAVCRAADPALHLPSQRHRRPVACRLQMIDEQRQLA